MLVAFASAVLHLEINKAAKCAIRQTSANIIIAPISTLFNSCSTCLPMQLRLAPLQARLELLYN
jgi:hypothetical protein